MKIIHCADLHLDSKMESNLDSEKARIRRDELLDTYERMVHYAVEQQVAVIMFSGDVFDKPHVRKIARNRVLEQMYENPQIDFLYLQGNHDKVDFINTLDEEERPENLKIFSADDWVSYSYEEVVITGREIRDNNCNTLATNLILDQSHCNIVMLHGQESDYMGKNQTYTIALPDFKNKNIDYLALGHIHTYQSERLDDRGEYCYPGCLEGRGFDECGEKGFVLLEIKDNKITSEFIPFAKRKLHVLPIDVTPQMKMPAIIAAVEDALKDISEVDLVKILLQGTTEMDFYMDTERLLRTFEERLFFLKVEDATGIVVNYESFANDRSLKGEFVRLMQKQDMPEEKRSAIVELGMKAILGEEI